MDTTALRHAYDRLFGAAATPDLGRAEDGGWDADQVLAHLVSVDTAIAAVALGVVSGARPTFDNRISLDVHNLGRLVAAHPGRSALLEQVRHQSTILCDVADQLDGAALDVLVPTFIVSNDALVIDQPLPLAALINGLADDHVPVHTAQLLGLRAVARR